jgi:hypothetical protein
MLNNNKNVIAMPLLPHFWGSPGCLAKCRWAINLSLPLIVNGWEGIFHIVKPSKERFVLE